MGNDGKEILRRRTGKIKNTTRKKTKKNWNIPMILASLSPQRCYNTAVTEKEILNRPIVPGPLSNQFDGGKDK